MLLGSIARSLFPETGFLHPTVGDVVYILGFMVVLELWGFGLMWLAFLLATIWKSSPFPFNMGWWGFTFPLVEHSASTIQLGTDSDDRFNHSLGNVKITTNIDIELAQYDIDLEEIEPDDIDLEDIEREEIELEEPYDKLEYKYFPFQQPNTIRVLDLFPGKFGHRLHGKLRHRLLEASEPFETLSYAWGPSDNLKYLVTEDGLIPLTLSLHSALQRLRSESDIVTIWADAVCINQDNNEEKSEQVAMMGDIYLQAVRTRIWLGESDKQFRRAFKGLRILGTQAEHLASLTGEESFEGKSRIFWKKMRRTFRSILTQRGDIFQYAREPYHNRADLKDVWAVLELPWFNRVWVLQEFVLSRDILVICGEFEMAWDLFYHSCLISGGDMEDGRFLRLYKLNQLRLTWMIQKGVSLHDAVLLTLDRQCTRPQDRLFGVLGLSNKVPDQYADLIRPDYAEDINTYAAEESSLQLPSWVPDWSSRRRTGIGVRLYGSHTSDYKYSNQAKANEGTAFQASKRLQASVRFLNPCYVLQLFLSITSQTKIRLGY